MSGPGCVVVHGGQMAPKAGSCLIDFFFFFLSDTETSSNVHTWRSRDTAARQVSGLQIEARRRAAILWTLRWPLEHVAGSPSMDGRLEI